MTKSYREIAAQARANAISIGCPSEVLAAFLNHAGNARARHISFEFTLEEWWTWWKKDNRWGRRGGGANGLCMARLGDVGPYNEHNTYCATIAQNNRDVGYARRSAFMREWHEKRQSQALGRRPQVFITFDEHQAEFLKRDSVRIGITVGDLIRRIIDAHRGERP